MEFTIPRYGFDFVIDGDNVIIAGGKNDKREPQTSVVKIDLYTYIPVEMEPMNIARRYFNLIKIPLYNSDA